MTSPDTEKQNASESDKPWQFQPGQSGNPRGGSRPQKVSYQQLAADVDDEAKRRMILALVRKAEKGDVRAFEELANRAEGKPAVRVIHEESPALAQLLSSFASIDGEYQVLEDGAGDPKI